MEEEQRGQAGDRAEDIVGGEEEVAVLRGVGGVRFCEDNRYVMTIIHYAYNDANNNLRIIATMIFDNFFKFISQLPTES